MLGSTIVTYSKSNAPAQADFSLNGGSPCGSDVGGLGKTTQTRITEYVLELPLFFFGSLPRYQAIRQTKVRFV